METTPPSQTRLTLAYKKLDWTATTTRNMKTNRSLTAADVDTEEQPYWKMIFADTTRRWQLSECVVYAPFLLFFFWSTLCIIAPSETRLLAPNSAFVFSFVKSLWNLRSSEHYVNASSLFRAQTARYFFPLLYTDADRRHVYNPLFSKNRVSLDGFKRTQAPLVLLPGADKKPFTPTFQLEPSH